MSLKAVSVSSAVGQYCAHFSCLEGPGEEMGEGGGRVTVLICTQFNIQEATAQDLRQSGWLTVWWLLKGKLDVYLQKSQVAQD